MTYKRWKSQPLKVGGADKELLGVSKNNIAILDFLPCELFYDLVSEHYTIANIIVDILTEVILCLSNLNISNTLVNRKENWFTSCSTMSMSILLILSLRSRMAFPIVTDMGRADTKCVI